MATRRDRYQLDIQFITDESRAFAKTVQETKQFTNDLRKAQKEGQGVAEVMQRISQSGRRVAQLDLTNVAPQQLIDRGRQLRRILRQIPESAPGVATLRAEYKAINDRLADIRAQSKGVVQSSRGLNSLFGSLRARAVAAVASFTALWSVLRNITKTSSDFQKFEAVLTNALGSRSKANRAIDQLTQFAAKTPFQLEELIGSYVKFVNRGLRPTEAELTKMADLAASQGKSFDQLTEAILDAGTGEFVRLKEFGITAKTTGDQVTLAFKNQEVQVAKTQEAISAALIGFGELNGVQGSTAAIAETLGGKISNLSDQITQLWRNLGDTFVGRIIGGAIGLLAKFIGKLNDLTQTTKTVDEVVMESTRGLRTQRLEMNAMFEALKKTNLRQEDRARIIEKLNEKYGQYLPQLLTEKSSLEEITAAQSSANAVFFQRIKLMAAETRLRELYQRQIDANLRQAELELEIEEKRVEVAQESQRLARLRASRTGGGTGVVAAGSPVLREAQQAIEDNLALIDELAEQYERAELKIRELGLDPETLLAQNPIAAGGSTGGTSSGGGSNPLDAALKRLEETFKLRELLLIRSLLQEEITEQEYARRELERLKAYYEAQLQLFEQFNQARSIAAEEARNNLIRTDRTLNPDVPAAVPTIESGPENDRLQHLDELRSLKGEEIKIEEDAYARKADLIERERELRLDLLEVQKSAINEGFNFLIDTLGRDEEARKRNAAAIKAFEAGRILVAGLSEIQQIRLAAASQAAINPLLAPVITARATAQTIAAALRTAISVRRALAAKFEEGGIAKVGRFGGKPHSRGGTRGYFDDGTVIEVERDEVFAVVNKRSSQALRNLSDLNVAGGGRPYFASGGVIAPRSSPTPGIAAGGNDNDLLIAEIRMLRAENRSQRKTLRAEVVYTDIETAANDIARVEEASSV